MLKCSHIILLPSLSVCVGLLWQNADFYLDVVGFYLTAYLMTNVWLLEVVSDLHAEKVLFRRELSARATSPLAAAATAGAPVLLLSALVVLVFLVPALSFQNPESGLANFWQSYLLLYLAVVCNLFLNQLVGILTPSAMLHSIVFPGLVVPCQALFCGFVVVPHTMFSWLSWGVDLSPLRWVLNGIFKVNVMGNSDALLYYDFDELEALYGWEASAAECCLSLLVTAAVLKAVTCCTLEAIVYYKYK
jgi:hypothetical protein